MWWQYLILGKGSSGVLAMKASNVDSAASKAITGQIVDEPASVVSMSQVID